VRAFGYKVWAGRDLAAYILPCRSMHPIRTGSPNLAHWESGQPVPDDNIVRRNQTEYRLQLFISDGDERMLGNADRLKCGRVDLLWVCFFYL
jgi:hypothetical protein